VLGFILAFDRALGQSKPSSQLILKAFSSIEVSFSPQQSNPSPTGFAAEQPCFEPQLDAHLQFGFTQ
jgi:hypothetical protein